MAGKNFYTFSEYMKKGDNPLTASMEDYLEMIWRLSLDKGFTRIHDLSTALNVQPPSATKMVQRLAEFKFLKYEKYGVIILTNEGREYGKFLLKRHKTIEKFLSLLGVSETKILEQTEKVEHTINEETIICFEQFIEFMKENPEIFKKFCSYIKSN